MKLTPMDVMQRRLIKRYYTENASYIIIWNGQVKRYYRVMFGRASWSNLSGTKRWFNKISNIMIYNVFRGKRRFKQ